MLLGRYDTKLGSKYQISFPKKFRQELGDRLVITKGLEKNLIVVSEEHWKTLLEGTQGLPFIQKPTREMQRYLLGNAQEVELDSKGRYVIPSYLREYAGLKDEVVCAGIERFVEIWDKKMWENEQERLGGEIETVAEKLNQSVQKETNG